MGFFSRGRRHAGQLEPHLDATKIFVFSFDRWKGSLIQSLNVGPKKTKQNSNSNKKKTNSTLIDAVGFPWISAAPQVIVYIGSFRICRSVVCELVEKNQAFFATCKSLPCRDAK